MKHYLLPILCCVAFPALLLAGPKGAGSAAAEGESSTDSSLDAIHDSGSVGPGAQGGGGASSGGGASAGAGLGFDLNRPDEAAFAGASTPGVRPDANLTLEPPPETQAPIALARQDADRAEVKAAAADHKVTEAKMTLDRAKARPWESTATKLAAYRQAVQEAREARQKAHQAWTRYEEARKASEAPPLSLAIEASDRAHASVPTLNEP